MNGVKQAMAIPASQHWSGKCPATHLIWGGDVSTWCRKAYQLYRCLPCKSAASAGPPANKIAPFGN